MRLSRHIPVLISCSSLVLTVGCAKPTPDSEAPEGASAEPVPTDEGNNLLKQENFDDGVSLPWTTSFTAPADGEAKIKDGALCLDVDNPGTNKWDAQLRHREMVIQKGHRYTVDFVAWASRDTRIRPKVGQAGPPYVEWWAPEFINLSTKPQRFVDTFVMQGNDDPTAEFAFHVGGRLQKGKGPIEICIDDVKLSDPDFTPQEKAGPKNLPKLRVNQQGYLPKLTKIAVLVDESSTPQSWELLDAQGQAVAEGKTEVFGQDPYAGESVHRIDFSAFQKPGKGYLLRVGKDESYPFDIENGVYDKLRYDALAYFYHNRSGIPIEMPYAGEEKWTRPAGHPKDVMKCAKGSGCDYSLDVTGGWYDAGDQGKYVVNGGISVWTLMNQYEEFKAKGRADAFGDHKLSIPENQNRVPDILDEARWELEFLLKMQVPEGKPLAGMVHHKGHDVGWTALGTRPDQDKMQRELHPPSTAATLNLAATAAQGARSFKPFDPKFAARCLAAAERAYHAAKQHPKRYAPPSDGEGGGPYDDNDVGDEFYWAAAELFITTGKLEYKRALTSSAHNDKLRGRRGTDSLMTWQVTDGLGAISLATATYGDAGLKKAAQAEIIAVADKYREIQLEQGYLVPFEPSGGGYPWGSNSFVLNNMLVLALAYDFTGKEEYRSGVVEAADYLLGKNALSQSYVTGYGENPLRNPHHRFWAHQANKKFPEAPPGAISGGPNSALQDPYAQAAGLAGCKPAQCFIDNIESWSTNEITINWNAPLAWVAGWLAAQGK